MEESSHSECHVKCLDCGGYVPHASAPKHDCITGRAGYCAFCRHSGHLPESAAIEGNPCNGCWNTETKQNWLAVRLT